MANAVTLEQVVLSVAYAFGLRVNDIMGRRRFPQHAGPRQIAYALGRKHTNLSLPQIGKYFGGRDHKTILHGIRKFEDGGFSDMQDRIDRAEVLIEKCSYAVFIRNPVPVFRTCRRVVA